MPIQLLRQPTLQEFANALAVYFGIDIEENVEMIGTRGANAVLPPTPFADCRGGILEK